MKLITKGFYGLLSIWLLSLAVLSGCGAKTPTTTADTTAPASPSVSINSGASRTLSNAVTLALSATDDVGVTGYYASETSTTPSASATGWTSVTSATSYSASTSFTLSSGDASKAVYVWFKDTAGNVSSSASDSITLASKLVGTWGEVTLDHNNDGTWSTEMCKFTYNSDNTGTGGTCQSNYGGTLGTDAVVTVTYSVVSNSDGSLTLNKSFPDGTQKSFRWVMGDDGNVMILDGTTNTNKQRLRVAVRLDTSKTYTNADLIGNYFLERYRYNGSYEARSGIETFDGAGNRSISSTDNTGGIISTSTGTGTYSLNSDGSYTLDSGAKGYLTGDGKLGADVRVTFPAAWSLALSMKKGDKTYSTADLAGTWAYITFGDNGGTSFSTQFATMTCDSSGNCSTFEKIQTDGSITYQTTPSTATTLSVASNGSITDANNVSKIMAIGNNGNTMIVNNSFDTNNSGKRRIGVFIKCTASSSLSGTAVSQFDGTYTGSWSRLCPTCGASPPDNQSNSGTFTVTVANGVFSNISLSPPVAGAGGPRFDSGTVSSSGAITGTGASPSQCSSVSTFTGQIVATSSGSAVMTITYSRPASSGGCAAETGTLTATRL